MALTQTDLDNLDAAIATSELEVEIDGRRYEAFSRNGHAEPGDRLRVVGLDNFRLIVSKI